MDTLMQDLVASMRSGLDQKEAKAIDLSAQLQEVEGEAERLRNAIGALEGAPPPKRTTKRKAIKKENGASTGYGVSLESVRPIHDKILEVVQGGATTFNQKDIYKPMGLDQSRGSSGFQYLRSIGFLRMAGRDIKRKCDLYAIMDEDAFEVIWKDTFERDLDAEREALIERLRTEEGVDPSDRLGLVSAYLREREVVRGWNTVADDLNLPKHATIVIKAQLEELKLIECDTQQGRPSIIKWVGTAREEALSGAA